MPKKLFALITAILFAVLVGCSSSPSSEVGSGVEEIDLTMEIPNSIDVSVSFSDQDSVTFTVQNYEVTLFNYISVIEVSETLNEFMSANYGELIRIPGTITNIHNDPRTPSVMAFGHVLYGPSGLSLDSKSMYIPDSLGSLSSAQTGVTQDFALYFEDGGNGEYSLIISDYLPTGSKLTITFTL